MCGINGIFAYGDAAAPIDREALLDTRDHMAMRGPDGAGEWIAADGRLGLGHRRLSIIDLSAAGAQPMVSADGRIVVTFNGEIYNHEELRRRLSEKGRVFWSRSDTEVLLHLYAERGDAMVSELRGMFAFALWDAERRRLLLARDPYGIKPLYFADDGCRLSFASSVKALLAGGEVSREPDSAGVVGFYLFGSVPEPFTIYRSIRAVPAGASLVVDSNGPGKPKQYYSIGHVHRDAEIEARQVADENLREEFRDAILDSVRHHLVSDVPVGAFLSAGVDSGALVGLMRDIGQVDIKTITLQFGEFEGAASDEAPCAHRLASFYETNHVTRRIDSREFEQDLPKIIAAMDQPSIDGVNCWFVAKAGKEIGLKVAMSGVGGDELLGGYGTFASLPRCVRLLGPVSRLGGARVTSALVHVARSLGLNVHPKASGMIAYGASLPGAYLLYRGLFLPEELSEIVGDATSVRDGLRRLDPIGLIGGTLEHGPTSSFGSVATLESSLYLRNQLLRDADWAGMAHSLEIRTPLVDSILLRRIAPILARRHRPSGKSLLANAPRRPLPSEIANRQKTGFGIPIRFWARNAAPELFDVAGGDARLWSRCWARGIFAMHSRTMIESATTGAKVVRTDFPIQQERARL
jgi:asparagine synthase (glutamine-hydrolysing)